MAKVLTQLAVERFKPPAAGRTIHWDGLLPGFGLRMTAKGAKSWVAMYRVAGKPVMQTLGSMSAIPKVDTARKLAREAILAARSGINPVDIARAEKAEAETTFAAVVERYLRQHVDRHVGTAWRREVHRILEREVNGRWADRPIREITRADINRLIDEKADQGYGVQANRILGVLRALFSWSESRDVIDANPTKGVQPRAKETPRDRVLTDDEIVAFWHGCDQLAFPFAQLFKLLLLTAQRRDQIARLTWSEVDLEHRRLVFAGSRMKNGEGHEVHLGELAVEIIAGLPRFADSDFVFVGRTGSTPASGFSKPKRQLDAMMGKPPHWVLHDLRRTAATGMARLGVGPHICDRVLAHTAGTALGSIASIYNRYEFLTERQAALEAWSRFVESRVRPTNVVQLVR
jgi:integrase